VRHGPARRDFGIGSLRKPLPTEPASTGVAALPSSPGRPRLQVVPGPGHHGDVAASLARFTCARNLIA
jgi:hypothetical protein